ncbi:MAG: OmpA/MotB family protein [Planctomycetota bacterium]|jgi:chemotaxis protein MotB
MKSRFTQLVFLGLVLAALPSCTARYQQMLMHKDMQIRDLQARIAELTATNADLEARDQGWRSKAASWEKQAQPAVDVVEPQEISRVQKDLGDVANVRYRNGRLSIGIDNVVTFSPGSTKLKSTAGQTLRRVARVVTRDYPNNTIYVEGHTDSDPIRKTKKLYRNNRHLSAERAEAVAGFLTSKCGIPEDRLVVVGYGANDPVAKGASRSSKAKNRRVEIVVGELQ